MLRQVNSREAMKGVLFKLQVKAIWTRDYCAQCWWGGFWEPSGKTANNGLIVRMEVLLTTDFVLLVSFLLMVFGIQELRGQGYIVCCLCVQLYEVGLIRLLHL